MKLTERVHVVGSGWVLGFGLSHMLDCHVYSVNGGKILMTNVYDCDFQQYVRSVQKLGKLSIDALLPGHLSVVLNGARYHIQKALDCFARMVLPPNII